MHKISPTNADIAVICDSYVSRKPVKFAAPEIQ